MSNLAIQTAVIANAVRRGLDIGETEQIFEAFDKAYQFLLDDVDYEKETVDGEFSNHHTNLYARAKDGTEYNMTGEVWSPDMKGGEVVGNFPDASGNIVLVLCPSNEGKYCLDNDPMVEHYADRLHSLIDDMKAHGYKLWTAGVTSGGLWITKDGVDVISPDRVYAWPESKLLDSMTAMAELVSGNEVPDLMCDDYRLVER